MFYLSFVVVHDRLADRLRACSAPVFNALGFCCWAVALLLALGHVAHAQLLDTGYNPNANDTVFATQVQPDGKLLVAGEFTQIAGQPYTRLARLRVDGSADPGFPPIVVDGPVYAIALQSDGRIVIGGGFAQVGAAARNRIARLNADGSLDSSFDPGPGANELVSALAVQADGKLLLGGFFTSVNGFARNRIARLNADGSLDSSFDAGTGGFITTLAVQADGKLLLGGFFNSINDITRNCIARLNSDGSLDNSFNPGNGVAGGCVSTLAVQADGKLLLGGSFTTINGDPRNRIARLNADGSLDSSFNPGIGANSVVNALAVQADGKLLLGGRFTTINGDPRNRIARLNADGSLDSSFNPGTGANVSVEALAVQADGMLLLGGNFTEIDGNTRNRIARLNADGSLDIGFNPGPGANGTVRALAVQADGMLLLGGNFTSVDGFSKGQIARLNTNGSIDIGFDPILNSFVYALSVQVDRKKLLGGFFTSVNGFARNRIARLSGSYLLDGDFNPGTGANNFVNALALQADGKLLLGGNFTEIDGNALNRIARLNADGSLDSSFDPGTGANNEVRAVALQADGKLLLGGNFTTINGDPRNRIARLNADGSLDNSFDPGAGAGGGFVLTLAVQADGKLLLGGSFTTINGDPRNRIARLNADGSLDSSFDPGSGANSSVNALALQADGKLLLAGDFTTIDDVARNRIARLNADGSLDTSFDPGTGANDTVRALALQVDGQVLLGGEFTSINDRSINRIARLSQTDAALQQLLLVGQSVQWLRSGTSPELSLPPQLEFSVSGALGTYAALGAMNPIAGGWQLTVPTLPVAQNFYLRANGQVSSGQYNGSSGQIESTALLYLTELPDHIFGGPGEGGFEDP